MKKRGEILRFKTLIILTGATLLFFAASYAKAEEARRFGLGTPPLELKGEIKDIHKLGVGILRVTLQWQVVEPKPGEFDWSRTDRIVGATHAKEVEILFTLRSISSWGTKNKTQGRGIYHSGSAPADMRRWNEFVTELAKRYKGRGVYYEIENEVNGRTFWDGTQDEYVELLKESYKRIKSADPQTKVLSSAMGCGIVRNFPSGNSQNEIHKRHDGWLKAILSTKAFDVVSVHDYYFPSDIVANGFTFRSYIEHIRDLMKRAGAGDHPIWITETGYVSRPTDASGRIDNGSPEKQAKWLEEAYRQAFSLGVERVFWLLLRDHSEAYFGSMGLSDAQGKPRPAWGALQKLIGTISPPEQSRSLLRRQRPGV